MPNELKSKKCDAFMEEHLLIYVGTFGYKIADWEIWLAKAGGGYKDYNALRPFPTREAAITAYWQKYHPEWTPPVVHDEVWALEYAKEKGLHVGYIRSCKIWNVHDWGGVKNVDSTFSAIDAVEAWQAKYDPDKPEPSREERLEGLLKKIVASPPYKLWEDAEALRNAIEEADDFLKEADRA